METVGELKRALRDFGDSEPIELKLVENPDLLDAADNILLKGPTHLLYLEINGTRVPLN